MATQTTNMQAERHDVKSGIYILIFFNLAVSICWYYFLFYYVTPTKLIPCSGCFHMLAAAFIVFYHGPDLLPDNSNVSKEISEENKNTALRKLEWTVGIVLILSIFLGVNAIGAKFSLF